MIELQAHTGEFRRDYDCAIGLIKDVYENLYVHKQEATENVADTATIAKEDNETMIGDLLKMLEIIQMVTDVCTKDAGFTQKSAEFMPACTEYEKNHLSLYRDAAKKAADIFERWADEGDDLGGDYEPDEFFSD